MSVISISPFTKDDGGPSLWLLLSEPFRAAIDLSKFFSTKKILLNDVPRGDGHPVIVVPGFLTSDKSTHLLRKFIGECGYIAEPWGFGRNLGQYEDPQVFKPRLDKLTDLYGQKISVVGWSLGGVYAREIARAFPDQIRQVITLGSPFNGLTEPNNVRWLYELLHGKKVAELDIPLLKHIDETPSVPCTAIFSKTDGVVPWKYCLEKQEDESTQNVAVSCSHWSYGYNPSVLYCIADRLAQTQDKWQHFQPKGMRKWAYPNLRFKA